MAAGRLFPFSASLLFSTMVDREIGKGEKNRQNQLSGHQTVFFFEKHQNVFARSKIVFLDAPRQFLVPSKIVSWNGRAPPPFRTRTFDTNLPIHLVVRKDSHDSMNLGSCRTSVPVQHILYVQKKNGIVAYMFWTNESCWISLMTTVMTIVMTIVISMTVVMTIVISPWQLSFRSQQLPFPFL